MDAWLSENGPVLAMVFAASTLLLLIVLGLVLSRLAAWRDSNRQLRTRQRRESEAARAAQERLDRLGATLGAVADWQASTAESLAVLTERSQESGDLDQVLALTIAQGDLARAQTELEAVSGKLEAVPMAAVEALLESINAVGVNVSLVEIGERRPLRPGYGAAMYAVLREGLQNVAQFAGHEAVTVVRVAWTRDDLLLEIEDDVFTPAGRHAAGEFEPRFAEAALRGPVENGYGILVMRHHVERYGGIFYAGPQAHGGFLVRALFPGALGAGMTPGRWDLDTLDEAVVSRNSSASDVEEERRAS